MTACSSGGRVEGGLKLKSPMVLDTERLLKPSSWYFVCDSSLNII